MKAIVFDFDGTLVNSEHLYLDVLVNVLRSHGIEGSADVFEELRSQHPERLFDELLGPTKGQQALADFKSAGKKLYGEIHFFHGILDVLKELKASGLKLGVWTARDIGSTLGILQQLQMGQFFDAVVSGSCVENNKPASDGLRKVTDLLGVGFEDVVMVGDHDHDIQAANTVGCRSVFARWKPQSNKLSKGISSSTEVDSVSDLAKWLGTQGTESHPNTHVLG